MKGCCRLFDRMQGGKIDGSEVLIDTCPGLLLIGPRCHLARSRPALCEDGWRGKEVVRRASLFEGHWRV